MKQKAFFLLILFLLSSLSACGAGPAEQDAIETDWTVEQMAAAVWAAGSSLNGTELLPGDEVYDAYMSGSYRIEAKGITDGAIWAAGGTSAQEVAVFQLTDASQAESAAERLETYLQNRIGAFTGYLPEEAALLEDAQVEVRGAYVALLACGDTAARDAFDRCFTAEPPEETERPWAEPPQPEETPQDEPPAEESVPTEAPGEEESHPSAPETPETAEPIPQPEPVLEPEELPAEAETPAEPEAPAEVPSPDWTYDEDRLLSAWAAGDWSGLGPEDQAILDVCREVLSTVVPSDGSAYDQELAVHDWMIAHGSYDSNTLSNLPDFQENPNNDNPYGFLVDGKGICLGYASTFQLFMDLLGIECITVEGTAYSYTADHAWNQVRLDGDWYCVDVTWDDPTTYGTVSTATAHRFFNVTAAYMRDTDHQWDGADLPDAQGTEYAWQN